MKFSKKIAIAAVPAVMALASTNVDSKILLMSQEGWEVSFDGAANAFIMQNSGTNAPTTSGGAAVTFDTTGGIINATNTETSIVTGLLPNVWGMTLKAPTANGRSRIGKVVVRFVGESMIAMIEKKGHLCETRQDAADHRLCAER